MLSLKDFKGYEVKEENCIQVLGGNSRCLSAFNACALSGNPNSASCNYYAQNCSEQ